MTQVIWVPFRCVFLRHSNILISNIHMHTIIHSNLFIQSFISMQSYRLTENQGIHSYTNLTDLFYDDLFFIKGLFLTCQLNTNVCIVMDSYRLSYYPSHTGPWIQMYHAYTCSHLKQVDQRLLTVTPILVSFISS